MLQRVLNMFRVADLRGKILFSLLVIAIYRLGAFVPAPGVDVEAVQLLRDQANQGGILGFVQLFSGGALTQFSVFALGIMPYITASIIMQILGVVIPKIEQWQQQGAIGQRKITQWTRYLTISIAVVQSTSFAFLFHSGGLVGTIDLLPEFNAWTVFVVVLTLTTGTALLMWMGELITQRGIGNGMSLLIFTSVVSTLPAQGSLVQAENGAVALIILILVAIALLVGIVFVEQGQRRIPVQFAKRVVGKRMYGGQSTYIPLKVNQSGVIPVIFASSMLYLPTLAASITGWEPLVNFNARYLEQGITWVYIALFASMTIFFTYFYSAITFNPVEVADNMKRYGGFVPGIRPGTATAEYLDRVLTRITLPGSLYLTVVAIIPFIALAVFDIQAFPLGGVGLLIMVGVALQTMQQVESQLMQRNYEGFLT